MRTSNTSYMSKRPKMGRFNPHATIQSEAMAPMQKVFSQPKLHMHPSVKFKPAKVANSGVDPHGCLIEFIKKDPIKNIDIHRDCTNSTISPPNPNLTSSKWAIGTTKISQEKLEHIKSLKRTSSQPSDIRLKTDNIGFFPPHLENQT